MIAFIGRIQEKNTINTLINTPNATSLIAIGGDGGIGKSRLLKEIHAQYHQFKCVFIDFSDYLLRNQRAITLEIVKTLDKEENFFVEFTNKHERYDTMQREGVGVSQLKEELQENLFTIFINCLNSFTQKHRLLLFFDTTDFLKPTDELWLYLQKIFNRLNNSAVFIAGRNAEGLFTTLQNIFQSRGYLSVLTPFSEEESRDYLRQKEKELKIARITKRLEENSIFLSGGRPIWLDLILEFILEKADLEWIKTENIDSLCKLESDKVNLQRSLFKKKLLLTIRYLNNPKNDLIEAMSYVFPLNIEIIVQILGVSKEEALSHFDTLKCFSFIKQLPGEQIQLHDEIQQGISEFIWPKDVFDTNRIKYNAIAYTYYSQKIDEQETKIQILRKEKTSSSFDNTQLIDQQKEKWDVEHFNEKINEEYTLLWNFKIKQWKHRPKDINSQFDLFTQLFKDATDSGRFDFRMEIFEDLKKIFEELSNNQKVFLNIQEVKILTALSNDSKAKEICDQLWEVKDNLDPEQQIETLILRGNAKIRLNYVLDGIKDFHYAVELGQNNYAISKDRKKSAMWLIKSYKELGWANRLIGYLRDAETYYKKGRDIFIEEDGIVQKEFQYDYGMILNNLVFIYSNYSSTQRKAIDEAQKAINHWKNYGNIIGLGAAYIVYGIACYRANNAGLAMENFDEALRIFEPLCEKTWLGQIFVWKGAMLRTIGKYEDAEKFLNKALETNTPFIKPMALNRLGRVYMSQRRWEEAKKELEKSIEEARKMPDYIYWLVSLSRLIIIAAEQKEYNRLNEFKQRIENSVREIKKPDKGSIGVAYVALARLALGNKDICKSDKVNLAVDYLQEAINCGTESGSYANQEWPKRIARIETELRNLDHEVVHEIGEKLSAFIKKKEVENNDYDDFREYISKLKNWGKLEI